MNVRYLRTTPLFYPFFFICMIYIYYFLLVSYSTMYLRNNKFTGLSFCKYLAR